MGAPASPQPGRPPAQHPGEPGVFAGAGPPFAPDDPGLRWLFQLDRLGIRPGLERIRGLLAALGHPERGLRTVVVAGTNGKGSTTRLLAALARAAGHRTACYTSPHLLRVHERLEIDGEPCAPDRFAAEAARLRPDVERLEASWFESVTAIALALARAEGAEVLCCEAGLGGRLDATNALPAAATVLTSVALDHEQILGGTLAEIAAEKLGLLKRGSPLFCAVAPELRPQVFAAAVAAGSPVHFLEEQARCEERGETWDLVTRRGVMAGLPAGPAGSAAWGRRNAALALLCWQELAAAGVVRFPADPAAALATAFLPARFQRVLTAPDWVFDTAHNTEALLAALDAYLDRPAAGRRWLLFGSLREKSLAPAVGERLRRCDRVVAAPVGLPRSRTEPELAALFAGWGWSGAGAPAVLPDLGAAIARLAAETAPADSVLVTGSCFTVAEVLYRLGYRDLRETRRPEPAAARLAPFRAGARGKEVERG